MKKIIMDDLKMVKSKFPGKPSKIVQRSLVRAFSITIPSCDSSTVSEEVARGLSVFDQTFGVNDEVSSFKGFSSAEIDRSMAKKEEFVSRVREKFAQRGISLASPPSSAARYASAAASPCPPIAVPRSSASAATETPRQAAAADVELPPIACKRERRKRGAAKLWLLNKKAAAGRHQQRHGKLPAAAAATGFKALNKNSLIRFKHKSAATNYLSDRYCRKFVLPSRSAHSSRVIKPNKRFADGDKSGKAGRLLLRNFKTHKYEADAKSRAADERARRGGAATTAGASGGAGNQLTPPGKVIIREARLNITSESAIAGPFSAAKKAIVFEKDKFKSGIITCGICGAIRHYKYILQTKKFGIYSCEPCRRFILKMIKQSKQSDCEMLECKAENGIGKCLIDSGIMCPQKMIEESPTKSSRCQACWLKLCLQKYMVPSTLRKMLIKLMPEELKVLSSCLISADLMRKSLYYETDNPVYRTKNEPEDGNDTLKKRLRIQHFSKSCSANRRLMEKSDAGSTKTRPFHVKNVPNHKSTSRHKWAAENSCKELDRKELQLPRGPRIKHVCRSASSVLRTSLATSNDGDEEDEESHRISSESEVNGAERTKNEDEKSEKHNGGDNCCHYDNSLENYSKQFEARTLQDFCKEAMVSTEDSEDKLISIDFWEAYDPDEIYKTGFSLIGTESTNVRALCFLCGSAGLEKLLYCVSCCEAYHWYCAEGPSVFREETELEKCRVNWVCRKCKVCSTCGERSARALISCQRCRGSYHPECLTNKALNKRLFNSDRPWVCPSCLKCKSCNNSSVFTFVGNVPLCSQCFKLRQKGNYCPLCQGCYEDEDYNVQMMECGICKCWIHAKCEGLSDEKYQILSFLPESIEFVCKLCCQTPPPQWWLAVEDELKTGYLGILKKLCKNKQINELFKESPRKNHVCQCQQSQPPESSSHAAPLDNSPPSAEKNPADETVRPTKRWLNFDDENETAQLRIVEEASSPDVAVTGAADDSRGASSDDGDSFEEPSVPAVKPPLESDAVTKPCEACSAAHEEPSKTNQGLLAVKSNVHNSRYASLSAFHSDLEQVIAQIDDGCFLATYHDTVKIFFPWFDVEKAHHQNQPTDAPVDAQLNDAGASGGAVTAGAELCDELANATDDEHYEQLRCLMAADDYPYEQLRMLDVRACILCKSMGEAAPTEGGRLIYCGRNEWVHSNCALWSSEVFEEIDGSLQNVHSAVSRGRQIRCSLCEKKGASIGCCFKNCGLTYHFGCARKVRCKFFHNKTIYCRAHETPSEDPAAYSLLTSEKDFEILRPVYVEMERKKKRLECHANVKLRIGSLLVESLGRIDPHLSDHLERIIPMHFRCTRLFWSTVKPWKIVRYYVQIRVRFTYAATSDESELNYTIEHSTPEEIVQRVLAELVRKVCVADEYRLCEANSGQTDLLFPELQDTIYKDLPTDVLNDHTLHDIWNNYDNVDQQSEASPPKDEGARTDAPCQVRPAVKVSPKARLKRDLKPAKSRTGKCANGKYLRDKNNVIRECAKQSYTPNYWYKQLRGRGAKRKMNFENASSQAARKRKYENCKLSESAARYFSAYENILQLDGMAEIYAGDEEPVKCVQCHRTYRTTLSFERHLETCNSDFGDFMISSCESDSASGEEDKYCAATGAELLNVANGGLVMSASSTAVNEFNVVPQMCDDSFTGSKYSGGPTTYIMDDKVVPVQSFNGGTANLCANVTYNGVYPYAAATYEDTRLMDNCGAVIQNNTIPLDTLLQGAVKQEPLPTIVSSPISLHTVDQPAMKLNFVSNGLVASKSCANYVTTPQFTFAGASLPSQQYEIQNLAAPAYVIHQSYPVTDIIPTYVAVDNSGTHDTTTYLSQPTTTLQQQLPTTSVNFQPIVPTILGTFVQPNIVETPTYIVNAAAASPATGAQTYGTAAPQSNIILPSQPMLFGLETVVSNTIMSSSQFLTQSHIGNVGASTMYSTTTTQVFQAAKPMPQQPDLGSGYIVLNPSTSVSSTPTILQTNVGQPTTVATSAGLSPAKQLEPVITSRPTDVETYMYVHLNQGSVPAASLLTAANPSSVGIERKKAPPMIMKPVKQPPIQPKKSIKIMKVKNNRPVSIEVKHISPVSIEVKHVPGTSPGKPSFVLSSSCNEQPRKLQIKTTDTAVMLGQHVPVYQFAEPAIPTKNVTNTPAPYRNGFCIKTPSIDQDQKAVPGLTERDVVTFKSEPVVIDINSSAAPTPITVPRVCSQISDPIHHIKRERTSPVEEANCNRAVTSSTLVQTASTKSESQPLFTPPTDTSLKIEKSDSHPKQLPSLQLSPSPFSQASKPVPSDSPSNEPAAKVPRTESNALSETERLFDELMRQHLENERRRKQRLVEATAVPKPASPPPALSPKVQMSASMPLLDEIPPPESDQVPALLVADVPSSPNTPSTPTEPPSEKAPYRFTLLKTKYKPRLQPRISEGGAVVGNVADKKVATGAALAAATAKKLNKSPEKENQEILLGNANSTASHKAWKTASISFEVSAEDGFSCKSDNLLELWNKILESVQQSRAKYKLPLLPKNASKDEESVYSLLGFENNASKYLIEQLPDAWKCIFYKPVFHKPPMKSSKTPLVENKTGCARSEPFAFNHKYDMFGWLSSESREPPKYIMSLDSEMLNANRRTSPNLPMAMRFRHLKDTAKETVFVFRSNIHGRGLFCLRDIDAEEMVIEYAGEVIRSTLTDKREKYYTSKGIGCYMFRIDDRYVVDATMRGNAARFINHSCEPNCYSRIVDILGKKHILIFALQKIKKGDELTYDYKFPLEDEKIACHCRKPKCRQYLN